MLLVFVLGVGKLFIHALRSALGAYNKQAKEQLSLSLATIKVNQSL